jgi:hypothetical protein
MRRRGRPRLSDAEPSVSVSVRLCVSVYDRACVEATRQRTTAAALIRRSLTREFRPRKSEPDHM